MNNTISFLGSSIVQNQNLSNLRTDLFRLQTQISTGKKATTYAGLDNRVLDLLSARSDLSKTETYQNNINIVSSRIEVMNTNLDEITAFANELQKALIDVPKTAEEPDLVHIEALIDSNKSFIQQLLNTDINGHYLFSGSASNVEPIENLATLENNIQVEMDAWFNGTQTYDEMIANIEALSDEQVGYSEDMSLADNIDVRVDDNLDVDYTVLANEQGFQDLLKVMSFLTVLFIQIQMMALSQQQAMSFIKRSVICLISWQHLLNQLSNHKCVFLMRILQLQIQKVV